MFDQAKISQWILEETHDKLDPQDPFNSIVNPAHRDNIVLHLEDKIINELGEILGKHDL